MTEPLAAPTDIPMSANVPARPIQIGQFVLDTDKQQLLRDGVAVRIGNRALSLLIALVELGGELVSKEALIARVWPDTFVDEANLRVHIAALRKALGDAGGSSQYIVNVSGRGYRLVAPIDQAKTAPAPPQLRRDGSPVALTRLIGRTEELSTLVERVGRRRLVTVSGPGGIGKTTVAYAVARKLEQAFDDGVVAVDLGAAAPDEHSLPQAIARALKVSLAAGDPLPSLVNFLKDRHLLLLLDNCEHIIDAVTTITEQLLRRTPSLHILATSTEPMRAEGEWIFRLPPLDIPSEAENFLADEALNIPAIELFVERAAASSEAFRFTNADVPLVSEICRRLDGNPLAIEIAAASVEAFGLRDLAAHLDDRFDVLVRGRRTAAPRHQTLRNLLDWSHSRLSDSEQATLRRLSIFRGAFTLDAARSVAGGDGPASTVVNDIASLVRKSLVTANINETQTTYRLLDSTRAYARERAIEAGEFDSLCAVHASYFESLLHRAEREWVHLEQPRWLDLYGHIIDDARAATDWAFSEVGDVAQAVRLTGLVLPLGFQYALIEEMRGRIEDALSRAGQASPREIIAEIRLNVALSSLGQGQKLDFAAEDPALSRAIQLADESGIAENLVAPLVKRATYELTRGNYAAGVADVDAAMTALGSSGDDMTRLYIERVGAQATDMLGDQARAVSLARRVLAHPAVNLPFALGTMQIDRKVSMRVVLARALWVQGFAAQAKTAALEALALARDDPNAICLTLGLCACPVALWSGLDDEARALTHELIEKSQRYTLHTWLLWGQLFEVVLARRGGTPAKPVVPAIWLQADTLATLDATMIDDEGIARAEAGLGGWANPELLRAAALRLATPAPQVSTAAWPLLHSSREQARAQGALAWELRTATTLAELHCAEGNAAAARSELEPVYERLREGLETTDAQRARALLEAASRVS